MITARYFLVQLNVHMHTNMVAEKHSMHRRCYLDIWYCNLLCKLVVIRRCVLDNCTADSMEGCDWMMEFDQDDDQEWMILCLQV